MQEEQDRICEGNGEHIFETVCVNDIKPHSQANQQHKAEYTGILEYLTDKLDFIVNGECKSSLWIKKKEKLKKYDIERYHNLVLEKVVEIITSKEFNYQSKKDILQQLPRLYRAIKPHIAENQAIPLYLDLGGGYHASTSMDFSTPVTYDITIGEVLVIYQIKKLNSRIMNYYPPGVRFQIIIDNGVANFINDIPFEETALYCARFRNLIRMLEAEDLVELLVESEICNWAEESKKIRYSAKDSITGDEHFNVMRFLGRRCSLEEAKDRMGRYDRAVEVSDAVFNKFVQDEIRFVQRAGEGQLTFRPFPGGAVRIQCGRLGFRTDKENGVTPYLVTGKSREAYECDRLYIDINSLIQSVKNKNMKLA